MDHGSELCRGTTMVLSKVSLGFHSRHVAAWMT